MKKHKLIPMISLISTFIVVLLICFAAFKWADFKSIYNVSSINVQGTNFFDRAIIEEKNNLINIEPLVFERMKISLEDYLHDVKAPRWKSGITWKKTPIDIINSFH